MQKKTVIYILAGIWALTVGVISPSSALAKAVAIYPFDDVAGSNTFKDGSGGNHYGQCANPDCTIAAAPGVKGYSLKFGGKDYVELSGLQLDPPMSIQFWVNPKVSGNQAFVGLHGPKGSNEFLIGHWDGKLYVTIGGEDHVIAAAQAGWQQIVVVVGIDGSFEVYRNGESLGLFMTTKVVNSVNAKPWVIGQDWDEAGPSDFFSGMIDELSFYDHVLSVDEIKSNYAATIATMKTQLPIAHLPFDEVSGATQFADIAWLQHFGKCVSSSCPTANLNGPVGKAIAFDGINDYIELQPFDVGNELTIAFWINPAAIKDGQAFIGKHDSAGNNQLLLGYWGNALELTIGGTSKSLLLKKSGWQHMAITIQSAAASSEVKVYQDGALKKVRTLPAPLTVAGGKPWVIGQEWDGATPSDYFKGKLDDVQIYAGILPAESITELFKKGDSQFIITENAKSDRAAMAEDLDLGHYYGCIRLKKETSASGNTVACWGKMMGSAVASEKLQGVPISNVASIATGAYHACALKGDGSIWCWGSNGSGQLGSPSGESSLIPLQVSGITDAIAVTAGGSQSCALLADHTVKCWGSNTVGQLGNGSVTQDPSPIPSAVKNLWDVVELATGQSHSCARLKNKTVKCWGSNSHGQLGTGNTSFSPAPQIAFVLDGVSIQKLSLGDNISCAIRSDGFMVCWGRNDYGQIAPYDESASILKPHTITPWAGSEEAARLSVGSEHSCAALQDGSVKCWGQKSYGQLGAGANYYSDLAKVPPITVPGISQASDVKVGLHFGCARTGSEGKLECWGINDEGQLGVSASTVSTSASPVVVQSLTQCPVGQVLNSDLTQCITEPLFIASTLSLWSMVYSYIVPISFPTTPTAAWTSVSTTGNSLYQQIVAATVAADKATKVFGVESGDMFNAALKGMIESAQKNQTISEGSGTIQTEAFKTWIESVKKQKQLYQELFPKLDLVLNLKDATADAYQPDTLAAYRNAVMTHFATLFTLILNQELAIPNCTSGPLFNGQLLNYLQSPQTTSPLSFLEAIQCQDVKTALAIDQALGKAYYITNEWIHAKVSSKYEGALRDSLLLALAPIDLVLADRTQDRGKTPAKELLQKFVVRLNASYPSSTSLVDMKQLPPFYLYNPSSKVLEPLLFSTAISDSALYTTFGKTDWKAITQEFLASVPVKESGSGDKNLNGVMWSQIESLCAVPKTYPVTLESKTIPQFFLNLAASPVLSGYGTCSFWDSILQGKMCCTPPLTTSQHHTIQKPAPGLLARLREFIGDLLISTAYAQEYGPTPTLDLPAPVLGDMGYIEVPSNTITPLSTSSFSISLWLQSDMASGRELWPGILSTRFGPEVGQGSVTLGLNPEALPVFHIETEYGGQTVMGPSSLNDGRWHHLVASFDGRQMQLFADGQMLGSSEQNGTPLQHRITPFIGSLHLEGMSHPNYVWQGALNQLKVFAQALSETEIATLAQQAPTTFVETAPTVTTETRSTDTSTWMDTLITTDTASTATTTEAETLALTTLEMVDTTELSRSLETELNILRLTDPVVNALVDRSGESLIAEDFLVTSLEPLGSMMSTTEERQDHLIDFSTLVVRATPISQEIHPMDETASSFTVSDTVIQIQEVIRGQTSAETVTVRDMILCPSTETNCSGPEAQRIPIDSGAAIFFLVPSPDPTIWYLAEPEWGRGVVQDGIVQGIQRSVEGIQSRIAPSTEEAR